MQEDILSMVAGAWGCVGSVASVLVSLGVGVGSGALAFLSANTLPFFGLAFVMSLISVELAANTLASVRRGEAVGSKVTRRPSVSARTEFAVSPLEIPSRTDYSLGTRLLLILNNQPDPKQGMTIKTVVHFEIPAGDVEKLSRFYSEVFGWKFEKAPMPGMDYWLITTGPRGKSVGGGMYKKMGESDRPRNFISVGKIDAAIEKFKAAGGTEVVGKQEVPGQGWSFIGSDPEGNVLALWEAMMQPRPARRRPTKGRKRKTRGRR